MDKLERTLLSVAAHKLAEARDAALKKAHVARAGDFSTPESVLHERNAEMWAKLIEDFERVMNEPEK